MYGIGSLKEKIKLTEIHIECPVKDCTTIVVRKRRGDGLDESNFLCNDCGIYIYPTTFRYEEKQDNLLWYGFDEDTELYEKINQKGVKRESRVDSDNSEDAVSWNVFRFLERNELIGLLMSEITREEQRFDEIIYWSYSQKEKEHKLGQWSKLNEARVEFGEEIERGSEPDIIVVTESTLFFIEAKVTASNETTPSKPRDPNASYPNYKKYLTGGGDWFSKVFKSDFDTIAIADKKYELLRFWLLGTWLAEKMNKKFHLVNLVLEERELAIENEFGKHIIQSDKNKFSRYTWDKIYHFVRALNLPYSKAGDFEHYIEEKSLGYNAKQELQKAFLK